MSMLRAAGSHTLTASGPLALRPRLSTGLPFLFHILIIPPPGWECQPEVDLFCRDKSKKLHNFKFSRQHEKKTKLSTFCPLFSTGSRYRRSTDQTGQLLF